MTEVEKYEIGHKKSKLNKKTPEIDASLPFHRKNSKIVQEKILLFLQKVLIVCVRDI